jgi:hypothetical protein
MRIGNYAKARSEFEAALNGGRSDGDEVEYGIEDRGVKISMSNMMNLRFVAG